MPIANVTVGEAITDLLQNSIINTLNFMNNRAVFATPGSFTWTVPENVHRFRVDICGGGGGGGSWTEISESGSGVAGGPGGSSFLASTIFVGVDAGTAYALIIGGGGAAGAAGGGGGTGGKSSFGPDLVYSNGGLGGGPSGSSGGNGTGNGQLHLMPIYALADATGAYGSGGRAGTSFFAAPGAGKGGICVISW